MKKEHISKREKFNVSYRFVLMKGIRNILGLMFILMHVMLSAQYVKYTYPNGIVSSEGTMVNGKPDGYWKTYYPDGGLKSEGNRLQFKLDSTWLFYRDDSTLERRITYREDIKQGKETRYNAKGKPEEEWNNSNGIKTGKSVYYYDTGELWKVIAFVNNKEEGKGIEYDKDGRIISHYVFKNGFIYSHEQINRYNNVNKRTGIWRELYANGEVRMEGNYTNGLKNGVFKNYDKQGKLLSIEQYVDDILVEGDEATGIPDIREEFYSDGQVKTSGSYKNGKKHGTFRNYDPRGKEQDAHLYEQDVKIAEGQLDSLGRRIGAWTFYYPTGQIKYKGGYKLGLKDGAWTYYYTDGKVVQSGSYINDEPAGNWKWYYSNSSVHRDEYYLRGKEDGHCVEYDSLGIVLTEGDYIGGLKTGAWVLKVNDHSEEGSFEDGERNGLWIWKYGDGTKAFEGEYTVGIPTGKHRYWYPNGQVKMRGEYEGGELSGRWDYYDEDGTMTLQLEYEGGVVVRINGVKIKLPEPKE